MKKRTFFKSALGLFGLSQITAKAETTKPVEKRYKAILMPPEQYKNNVNIIIGWEEIK